MQANVMSFHYNSCYEPYFYTGYIIKPYQSTHTVVHLALVDKINRYSKGVQTAFIVQDEGVIFGTMKHPAVSLKVTKEYWELFKGMCARHTTAEILVGEVPDHLADHYLKTYSGMEKSERNPHTPLPGIIVLEVQL